MSTILESRLTRQDYQNRVQAVNGAQQVPRLLRRKMVELGQTDEWNTTIQRLESIQALRDDWDGLGGQAPSSELFLTAVVLVHFWMENKKAPPTRVVASTAGTIIFEWQGTDGSYAEFEVDRPMHADIMLKLPGRPTEHLEWPTH